MATERIETDDEALDVVARTRSFTIEHYRCPPTSRQWCRENRTQAAPIVVFPRVPVWIHHDGDDGMVADRAAVMYYNPRSRFHRRLLDARGDRCDLVRLRADVAAALVPRTTRRRPAGAWTGDPERPFAAARGTCPIDVGTAARMLVRRAAGAHGDAFALEESMLGLLGRLAGADGAGPDEATSIERRHAELAEAAREVLAARFTETLALGDVADACDTSEAHLCRVFRRRFGTTMHRHRTRLRIEAGLEMLLDGDAPPAMIASDLGFSSQAHFITTFRRVCGTTPGAVRRARAMPTRRRRTGGRAGI